MKKKNSKKSAAEAVISPLTFIALGTNLADDKSLIFFSLSQKIGFNISCKLSPKETICMKYQSLFSEGKK